MDGKSLPIKLNKIKNKFDASSFFVKFDFFKYLKNGGFEGDFGDRFVCFVLVFVLIIFFCISKFYIVNTVDENQNLCWLPSEIENVNTWKAFAREYCKSNMYYWPPDHWPPPQLTLNRYGSVRDSEYRNRAKPPSMEYYFWTPYLFLVQAMLLYYPIKIWVYITYGFGIILPSKSMTDGEIQDSFEFNLSILKRNPGKAKKMALVYIIWKICNSFNCVLQLLIINWFFVSPTHKYWGPSLLYNITTGVFWEKNEHFPRYAFCDVIKTESNKMTKFLVKCPLILNFLYEKMALFLWFLFPFAGAFNSFSIFTFLYRYGGHLRKDGHSSIDSLYNTMELGGVSASTASDEGTTSSVNSPHLLRLNADGCFLLILSINALGGASSFNLNKIIRQKYKF